MIIDQKMMFCEKAEAKTAITSNVLDFVADQTSPYLNAHGMVLCILTPTAIAGTSITFKLQESADKSTYTDVMTTKALTATDLKQPLLIALPPIHKRYLKLVSTPTSVTAGTITAFIGNDVQLGSPLRTQGVEFPAETAASGS